VRTPKSQVLLAVQRDPEVLARFWSRVERPDADAACWEWRGRRTREGHPVFNVGPSTIAPARLAWLCSTGEFPLGGRVHRNCHNTLCVRPEHLIWSLGAATERRLAAETDGYVAVPGFTLTRDAPPCDWPRTVRMASAPADGEA
jgi:hypothetical protein